MKALLLAAGFGTRLRPYTRHTPKCLFPIDGQPLIDILIHQLAEAGCHALVVNTHHLHDKIEAHIRSSRYPVEVTLRHEPRILGTGGAIKNLADYWTDQPFMVLNSDILFDIDLTAVYQIHHRHASVVTMVMVDHKPINSVVVDSTNQVVDFLAPGSDARSPGTTQWTFTGIQVLSAEILDWIPAGRFCNSIDIFRHMLENGFRIKAHLEPSAYWRDIGTPEAYKQLVLERMAPRAFRTAWPQHADGPVSMQPLQGDGSDRRWFRLQSDEKSLILADHGIRRNIGPAEVDAYVSIGRHLDKAGLPVPKIYAYDRFSGYVIVEDWGDCSLQDVVRQSSHQSTTVETQYRAVIDDLVALSILGARGFDIRWTCQTAYYDASVIRELECRYFVEAFINGYLNIAFDAKDAAAEFDQIASAVAESAIMGFVHRDMQSRNIMVKNGRHCFIDFQGGRLGPIQYDLASLLIDPYVDLPPEKAEDLLEYAQKALASHRRFNSEQFITGYRYCALSRNLQVLGAFAFLSRRKHKDYFEQFIPVALRSLNRRLAEFPPGRFPRLTQLVKAAADAMAN